MRRVARRRTTSWGSIPPTSKQTRPAERPAPRRAQPHASHVLEAGLETCCQRVHARLHARPADRLVKTERCSEGPAVLEGVESPRRQAGAVGRASRRRACEPGAVARTIVERGDGRPKQLTHPRVGPENARSRVARTATCDSPRRRRHSRALGRSTPPHRSRGRRPRRGAPAREAPLRSGGVAA